MSSLYRLFTDFFRSPARIAVGDLVKVTEQVADISPDEALVVISMVNMTKRWTIVDVVRPGSSDKRAIDLSWLQKWDGVQK
jgi:hypothetical protein